MNLVSRMRNAGDASRYCTTLVLIPVLKSGGSTDFGNQQTFLPAFLISLVFTVRRTLKEIIGAYKRTENSTASPREKQYLKSKITAYIQNAHSLPYEKIPKP